MPGRGHGTPADSFKTLIDSLPDFTSQALNAQELSDAATFTSESFDLLIVPTGAAFPAEAVPALFAFLQDGGDLLTTGGYAFDDVFYRDGKGWKEQRVMLEEAAVQGRDRTVSLVPGGDFEVPSEDWFPSNTVACTLATEEAFMGKGSARVSQTLETGSAAWTGVLECLPGKSYLIGAHVKCDKLIGRGYVYLAVYQYDGEGTILEFTDFAQVNHETDWRRYESVIAIHPKAETVVFKGGLYLAQGSMYFDEVTCGGMPGEIRINAHYGKAEDGLIVKAEQLKIFSPDRRFAVPCAVYRGSDSEDQALDEKKDLVLQGYEATAQLSGVGQVSPLQSLQASSPEAPCLATLVYNHDGRYKNSHWALFGVDNLDLMDLFPKAYEEALLRLQAGMILSSLKIPYASYRSGETGELQVTIQNTSRMKRTVRMELEITEAYASFFEDIPNREITLDAGESRIVTCSFTLPENEELPSLCAMTARIFSDNLLCDEQTTGFVFAALDKESLAPFEETGHCRFGTDFWSSTFYSPAQSPVTWNQDLALMKEKGLEVAEMLQFCPWEYRYKEEHWRIFDGWIQLCLDHGLSYMAGLLIGKNVCIDDDELAMQQELCRSFAHRYKNIPGLIYYLNGDFKLELSDSPDIRGLWNDFLAERYENTEQLAAHWKVDADQIALGSVPVTESPVRGWYDPRTRDMTDFKTLLMNRWIQAMSDAIRSVDREHPIISEYYQHPFNGIDLRRSLGEQHAPNFGYFDRPGLDTARFAATAKLYDMRRQGRPLHLGEFGVKTHDAWAEEAGGTHYHIQRNEAEQLEFFWEITHKAWALGFKQIQNWCWNDDPDNVFPWGLNWRNPSRPKPVLELWSELAAMSKKITVDHEAAEIVFVISDNWRSGALESFSLEVILNALDCMLASGIPFDVVSETALDSLQDSLPKLLVFPAAFALSEETIQRLKSYVSRGMMLYLSGDPGIDGSGERLIDRYENFLGCRFVTEEWDKYGMPVPQVECVTAVKCDWSSEIPLYELTSGKGRILWSPVLWEVMSGTELFSSDRMLTADPKRNRYLPLLEYLGFSPPLSLASEPGLWRVMLAKSGKNTLLSLFPVTHLDQAGSVTVSTDELSFRLEYDRPASAAILLDPDLKPLAFSMRGSLFYNDMLLAESEEWRIQH